MIRRIALILAATATLAVPGALAAADRTLWIRFVLGTNSKVVRGTVGGYDNVFYIVRVRAGQRLDVSFQANNRSANFNVWAEHATPGGNLPALFTGSSDGNRFSGLMTTGGDYRIQVYLMRNAARRGERASYTLTVSVR